MNYRRLSVLFLSLGLAACDGGGSGALSSSAITPISTAPGYLGHNGMVYDTTGINLSGNSTIYFAIKPENSSVFSQIALPLNQ